jgi:membrane protein
MIELVDRLKSSVVEAIWGAPLASLPPGRRSVMKAVRIVDMLLRDLLQGSLTLRAASLVFTTLLSLVPLLAVSFSLLKAFGVHSRLEGVLLGVLEPLGDQGEEIVNRLVQFVEQVQVGVLGGVGLLLLFVTVGSLIRKVEDALNTIWRVRSSDQIVQRISGYLSVLLVGPLLIFTLLGLVGTFMSTAPIQALASIEPFGTVLIFVPRLLPHLFMIAAFTFVYWFMPHTPVRFGSALVGGFVAGVLWAVAGWGFASFVAGSPSSNYTAIYSSFAIAFVFMLWIYVAWMILLIGATVAFYYQMPEYLGVMPGELKASNRLRERIVFAAMVRIGSHYFHGQAPINAHALAQQMQLPLELVQDALIALQADGFLALVEHPRPGYVPAREISNIALADLLASSRAAHNHHELLPDELSADSATEALMNELDRSTAMVLADRCLRDLVIELDEAAR